MDCYHITGGRPLYGVVPIHGAKNSVLPILSASILARGETVLHNCPHLSDVTATTEILRSLGCRVIWEGDSLIIDSSHLHSCIIPDALMQEMRSSVLFLGSLLARMGEATLCCPGGCALGPRPIDMHLATLTQLGTDICDTGDHLICHGKHLQGGEIFLDFPSVGATENIMLAACGAVGSTVLHNAAREPEIVDLQGFLRSMGAKVWGAGGATIYIQGGVPLHGSEYTVMADRIVAATHLTAVAIAKGEVELLGADVETLSPVIAALREAGCQLHSSGRRLVISAKERLRAIRPIQTAPYPGFPTDAQPMLMAALTTAKGESIFVETIFSERFSHAEGLRLLGARLHIDQQHAYLQGVPQLRGNRVQGYDLRGGAALVVAALGAEGESTLTGLQYIDRGYEALEMELQALGAQITRCAL